MNQEQTPADETAAKSTPGREDAPEQPEAEPTVPAEGAPEEGDQQASVQDLTLRLEDARAKADQHWEQLLRVRAEIENLKKRHERDVEAAHKFALERFVSELLQVWDSLELGHLAAQDEAVDVERLREGTELTLKLLKDVLSKFGVEQVDPQGEAFNPDYHQAMSMQPRDDVPANTVVAVVQKGCTLNGRLVRPAMVMVSRPASDSGVNEQA